MNPFDNQIFFAINGLAGRSGFVDRLAIFFATDAPYLIAVAFLLLWFLLPRDRARERRMLIYATVAAALGLIFSAIISSIWYRPRPFVAYPHLVHRLVAHPPDSSFPSDHATVAAAVFFSLVRVPALRWPAFVLMVAVMLARVFVGVHWPTDVLAGGVLGWVAAWLVWRFRELLEEPVCWLLRLFGYDTGGALGRQQGRG